MLNKLGTLKIKFPLISFFTYFVLVGVLLSACYIRFSDNMIETYEDYGEEILNLAAEDIVIDHIPDYLSGDYDRAEYEESVRKLNLYPRYFDDVFYLYAYHLNGDGANATYLFDAKVDHDDPMELGDNYELEDDSKAQIEKHGAVNEKAHTDALIGVRNKAAFEEMAMVLLGKMDHEKSPEIAVIMADINNLKCIMMKQESPGIDIQHL